MSRRVGEANKSPSTTPFYVSDHMLASAWIEHGPFAFWLVETLRPRCYVEIGIGNGVSYFCFCRAIAAFGLATRAFGVEDWGAEAKAPDALTHTNDGYSAFSRLIHSSFDTATAGFPPGSVDLLQIGGGATYETASSALAGWRPSLAEDAVVLLQGADEDGLGRLFDELSADHPAFRFPHAAGLGVVAVGAVVPQSLRSIAGDLGGVEASRTLDASAADRALSGRRPISSEFRDEIPMPGDAGPGTSPRRGGGTGEVVRVITSDDVDRLQARLREARSGEAAAQCIARGVGRALRERHGELGRQALKLEKAAASARTEVVELVAEVWKLMEDENTADQVLVQAQTRMDELLRHERDLLRPRHDLRYILSLGMARRLGRQAMAYADLVGKVDQAASDIRDARQAYKIARDERRKSEQLAIAAEPRASELASAAVVLRGEFVQTGEILSTLAPDAGGGHGFEADDYARWVDLYDTMTASDRREIKASLTRLDYKPTISIIMPVYDPPLNFLRQAILSVQSQLYTDWELCIADDASSDPAVLDLLRGFAAADRRIRLIERTSNGHISAASNSALTLVTGEFVALMDHDDILAEQALFEIAVRLNERRDLDLIYSDEDRIDQYGNRSKPYFKSDYNYDLMLGHNLVCHLGVYRRTLVEKVGGFRLGFEGSQDYDFALRVIDATSPSRIGHIPAVLYHWRGETGKPTFSEASMQRCIDTAQRALADHLVRRGDPGRVVAHPLVPVWQHIARARPDPAPLVSIIIPTKDKPEILAPCIDGLLNRTDYPNFEIVIVDHQSTDPAALELLASLARDPRVTVAPHEGPFNYSAINNAAVARTRGTVLALLNNDVEVIHPDWLDEMVALAALPEVGAVGAKLLYPDHRVQHAGILLGPGGVAGHYFHLLDAHDPGYFGRAVMTSTVAAVTGACLVVRKSVFEEVEGFDEQNLAVAFNDVDLCLKIRERGYRNVWTPHARLYHHESVSRGSDEAGERLKHFNRETEFMIQKWGDVLTSDPNYNTNFSLTAGDFSLSFPPRRREPWRAGV